MPAEWFPRETHALLANYCRHQISIRRVSVLMDRLMAEPELNSREYERLLRMRTNESRVVMSLATKMRLTQKSEYDQNRRKKDDYVPLESPWVKDGDEDR
jgi:hypothetical protein